MNVEAIPVQAGAFFFFFLLESYTKSRVSPFKAFAERSTEAWLLPL